MNAPATSPQLIVADDATVRDKLALNTRPLAVIDPAVFGELARFFRGIRLKLHHLSAIICFAVAALLYLGLSSPEYWAAFAALGVFFELLAWRMWFRKST